MFLEGHCSVESLLLIAAHHGCVMVLYLEVTQCEFIYGEVLYLVRAADSYETEEDDDEPFGHGLLRH